MLPLLVRISAAYWLRIVHCSLQQGSDRDPGVVGRIRWPANLRQRLAAVIVRRIAVRIAALGPPTKQPSAIGKPAARGRTAARHRTEPRMGQCRGSFALAPMCAGNEDRHQQTEFQLRHGLLPRLGGSCLLANAVRLFERDQSVGSLGASAGGGSRSSLWPGITSPGMRRDPASGKTPGATFPSA